MYRPDRIGPWPIGNLNKAVVVDAKADFTAHDVAHTTFGCYSLNTVSGINFISEKVVFSDNTLFLSPTQQVGFGVQLSGGDEEFNRHIYAISGQLVFHTVRDVHVSMVIGRLAAAPSTSASIAVVNPCIIPLDIAFKANETNHYSVNTEFISTELDGGTPPATFFDIAAFWRIANNDAGSNAVFEILEVSLAFHKYDQDLQTLDPNR